MVSTSPTIFQTRCPRCWQWTKKRLRPDGSTRTPKPLSLPSRVSRAVLRGLSALTRASVRLVLGIPFSRFRLRRRAATVADSVLQLQSSGEKNDLVSDS